MPEQSVRGEGDCAAERVTDAKGYDRTIIRLLEKTGKGDIKTDIPIGNRSGKV